MSTWTTVESQMNDVDCIKQTLTELGFVYQEHAKPVSMSADGYNNSKASLIVPKAKNKGLSYDVGFAQNTDGTYKLIISYSDERRQVKVGKSKMTMVEQIKQTYSNNKTLKHAKLMGYNLVSKNVDDQGRIKIMMTVG